MVIGIAFILFGLVYGWRAFEDGPTRIHRWMDSQGRKRFGGAISLVPALFFTAVGVVKIWKRI